MHRRIARLVPLVCCLVLLTLASALSLPSAAERGQTPPGPAAPHLQDASPMAGCPGIPIRFTFRAIVDQAAPPRGGALDRTLAVLERRVEEAIDNEAAERLTSVELRQDGSLAVELAIREDIELINKMMTARAVFEVIDPLEEPLDFGTIVQTRKPEQVAASAVVSAVTPAAADPTPGVASASPTPTGPIYEVILDNADVDDAYPSGGGVVVIVLAASGREKLGRYVGDRPERLVALVFDGRVIASLSVEAPPAGYLALSNLDWEGMLFNSVTLAGGPLPVRLEVSNEDVPCDQFGSRRPSRAFPAELSLPSG